MTQIKLFHDFLNENKDRISIKDIKYTTEIPNPANSMWVNWTAMVIYEVIEG